MPEAAWLVDDGVVEMGEECDDPSSEFCSKTCRSMSSTYCMDSSPCEIEKNRLRTRELNREILKLEGPFTSSRLWEGQDIKLPKSIEIKASVTTGSTVASDGIIIVGDGTNGGGNIYLWFGSDSSLNFGVQCNGGGSDATKQV